MYPSTSRESPAIPKHEISFLQEWSDWISDLCLHGGWIAACLYISVSHTEIQWIFLVTVVDETRCWKGKWTLPSSFSRSLSLVQLKRWTNCLSVWCQRIEWHSCSIGTRPSFGQFTTVIRCSDVREHSYWPSDDRPFQRCHYSLCDHSRWPDDEEIFPSTKSTIVLSRTSRTQTTDDSRQRMESQSSGVHHWDGKRVVSSPFLPAARKWPSTLSQRELIITTRRSVLKVPVARCERLTTSNLCSAAMDPYCTWNHNQQQCVLHTSSSLALPFSASRLLTCPSLNVTSRCFRRTHPVIHLYSASLFSWWWMDILVIVVSVRTTDRWKMSMSYEDVFTASTSILGPIMSRVQCRSYSMWR